MPTLTERPEDLVARWRTDAGDDNPAGPLFTSGPYAEVELAEPMATTTAACDTAACGETFGQCGTACTGSYNYHCC